MFRKSLAALSIGVLTFIGASSARAGEPSNQDTQFVTEAASAGMLEVRLGKYASENGSSGEVKKFGDEMVADHKKANDELKDLAASKVVKVPADLSDEHRKVLDDMEKLKGAEFDKAYVDQMVKDHKKVIEAFEKEKADGSDDGIKAFADKTLPVLRHHLEMAEDMQKKM